MSCCSSCKESKAMSDLCSDHRNFILELHQLSLMKDPRSPKLLHLIAESENHHRIEEKTVIPLLFAKNPQVATKLLADHVLLKTLKQELLNSETPAQARKRLKILKNAISNHITYETKVAFPLISI